MFAVRGKYSLQAIKLRLLLLLLLLWQIVCFRRHCHWHNRTVIAVCALPHSLHATVLHNSLPFVVGKVTMYLLLSYIVSASKLRWQPSFSSTHTVTFTSTSRSVSSLSSFCSRHSAFAGFWSHFEHMHYTCHSYPSPYHCHYLV